MKTGFKSRYKFIRILCIQKATKNCIINFMSEIRKQKNTQFGIYWWLIIENLEFLWQNICSWWFGGARWGTRWRLPAWCPWSWVRCIRGWPALSAPTNISKWRGPSRKTSYWRQCCGSRMFIPDPRNKVNVQYYSFEVLFSFSLDVLQWCLRIFITSDENNFNRKLLKFLVFKSLDLHWS